MHWNRNAAAVPSLQVIPSLLLLQALQSWTSQQSWSGWTKRVLLLCTDVFFSRTSPIVTFILWPQKTLGLDKGYFSHQQHHLKHTLGSWLNSLDLTFLNFLCISEKQEALTHQHHTSSRAWCEAHQKAIGIFLLVLVGFSYRLHSF